MDAGYSVRKDCSELQHKKRNQETSGIDNQVEQCQDLSPLIEIEKSIELIDSLLNNELEIVSTKYSSYIEFEPLAADDETENRIRTLHVMGAISCISIKSQCVYCVALSEFAAVSAPSVLILHVLAYVNHNENMSIRGS